MELAILLFWSVRKQSFLKAARYAKKETVNFRETLKTFETVTEYKVKFNAILDTSAAWTIQVKT